MRTLWTAITVGLTALCAYAAGDYGSAKEAEAMVKRAAALIRSAGVEKAYASFTGRTAGFADRDLYVVVYDLRGPCPRARGRTRRWSVRP